MRISGGFRFGAVVYYQNAYLPDLPIQQNWIDKLKDDRKFAYEILCGGRLMHKSLPSVLYVTKEASLHLTVNFTAKILDLLMRVKATQQYASIRRQLIKRRYLVLDERAETHKHKFVIQTMINNLGEKIALLKNWRNIALSIVITNYILLIRIQLPCSEIKIMPLTKIL